MMKFIVLAILIYRVHEMAGEIVIFLGFCLVVVFMLFSWRNRQIHESQKAQYVREVLLLDSKGNLEFEEMLSKAMAEDWFYTDSFKKLRRNLMEAGIFIFRSDADKYRRKHPDAKMTRIG